MGEAQGKTTKAMIDELGLDNDDDYGCDPKNFPMLVEPRPVFSKMLKR